MGLEPITRKEKIIAGENLEPITRLEKFLKEYGGSGGSGGGSGGVTTLHINITAINTETGEPIFTADKTPAEMQQAAATGPIWCIVTFEAGTMIDKTLSISVPPAWKNAGEVAFGMKVKTTHNSDNNNEVFYFVARENAYRWILDLNAFSG